MDADKSTEPFPWLTFFGVLLATMFIPIYRFDPSGPVDMVIYVWTTYLITMHMPQFALLTVPVIASHLAIGVIVARIIQTVYHRKPFRFSVFALLEICAMISIAIGATISFGAVGYACFFLVCVLILLVCNVFSMGNLLGIPIPSLHVVTFRAIALMTIVYIVAATIGIVTGIPG